MVRFRALLIAGFLQLPAGAHAHPHVWVDAASEIVFDGKQRITAIRHHWRFDEGFSAYALQGLDVDRDGTYSAEELEPLARENVESLKDFGYFTSLRIGDYQAGYSSPTDYSLDLMDDRLLLHFTLPLAIPVKTNGTAVLEVGDPEYYVAFSLPSREAVRLVDAPAGCRLNVNPGVELDATAAATLAEIGPDVRDLPADLQALAEGTANSAEVSCGGPVVGGSDAASAVDGLAGGGAGDLTALPAPPSMGGSNPSAEPAASTAPARSPQSAPGSEPRRVGILARWTAWIGALQAEFNRDLTAGLKGLKDGGAFWWLGGISFLYGIVHAAGPGHGKVVISSYLVANEARVRRGVAIAFVAAFVQAIVAVAVIGVLAVILNMTSMAIDRTAKLFEAGSFALVAALGVYLLARKGRAAWAMMKDVFPLRGGARGGVALSSPPAARQGHAHEHFGHSHAHHHHPAPIPSPQGGGEAPSLAGAAAAVLSVGIRPCTGALVVLVFALSQGIFWAGVASTFVMALGTAMTVAVLAAIAVGAKDLARSLSQGDDRRGAYAMLGLELAAALFIAALGSVLFVGTLAT